MELHLAWPSARLGFKQAWQRVVDQHQALRTAFHWESGNEPFQVVYRHVELPWRQYDWQRMSEVERERQIETSLQKIEIMVSYCRTPTYCV